MLWIVVLLEIVVMIIQLKIMVATEDIILQYLAVQLLVEVSFNVYNVANTLCCNHPPHSNLPTTVLHLLLCKPWVQSLPRLPPAPLYPI